MSSAVRLAIMAGTARGVTIRIEPIGGLPARTNVCCVLLGEIRATENPMCDRVHEPAVRAVERVYRSGTAVEPRAMPPHPWRHVPPVYAPPEIGGRGVPGRNVAVRS